VDAIAWGSGIPALVTAGLVNPRTGLFRQLRTFRGEPGDAPVHVVGADTGDTRWLGSDGSPAPAGGAGWTLEQAQASALGEAAERYAAGFVQRERITLAAARDVPDAVRGWALFSERQYAHPAMHYQRWDEARPLGWVQARSLADGRPGHVPAQFVWIPCRPAPGEPVLAPMTTTGLGAGDTWAEAVLAGLHEVVERDAFTLAWLQRAVPPLVDAATETPRIRSLRRYGRFRLFDLTHDIGLSTVLCLLEKPSAVGTVIAIGCATRLDGAAAAEKAVLEAFQSFPYIRELVRAEPGWTAEPGFANLRDFRDHCRLYTVHPEHRPGIAHLLDGPADVLPLHRAADPHASAHEQLKHAVARLQSCGLEAWVVDVTTPDVRAAGLTIVRVLVPGSQPLHGFHQAAHLAGPRLRDAGKHLPYLSRPLSETEVNPWPHPFA
jgi:ribosomal protein S12 methylthiotransferase accessory factor